MHACVHTFDCCSTAPRVVDEDVLITVITGTVTPADALLCVVGTGTDECFDSHQLGGSVGMGGWFISCWPFDSQFEFSKDG